MCPLCGHGLPLCGPLSKGRRPKTLPDLREPPLELVTPVEHTQTISGPRLAVPTPHPPHPTPHTSLGHRKRLE